MIGTAGILAKVTGTLTFAAETGGDIKDDAD
jgi:hypothetical protein